MAAQLAPPTDQHPAAPQTIDVRVHVTAADIAEGRAKDCEKCPVALAMLRAFDVPRQPLIGDPDGTLAWPVIGPSWCTLPNGRTAPLPPDARAFIAAFDKGQTVSPFSFLMRIRVPQ